MSTKPKIVVVVGPTATGKSDLAVVLAKKFDGEVISADSRQVYRGLNIGSGKITKREMLGVKHHLLDVAEPKRTYTVAQYQRDARKAIKEIIGRNKLPIIVGGTGFYIKAVVDGIVLPAVAPNPHLRRQLEGMSAADLFARLEKLDPKRAANIDKNNPRRLIRAIEIATALGSVPDTKSTSEYVPLWIGINFPLETLRLRINERLARRWRQGMLAEVRKLHEVGKLSWQRLEGLGLEYRYLARVLQGKLSRPEANQELEQAIFQYAKRQLTWFRANKRITWISKPQDAMTMVKNFLHHPKPR